MKDHCWSCPWGCGATSPQCGHPLAPLFKDQDWPGVWHHRNSSFPHDNNTAVPPGPEGVTVLSLPPSSYDRSALFSLLQPPSTRGSGPKGFWLLTCPTEVTTTPLFSLFPAFGSAPSSSQFQQPCLSPCLLCGRGPHTDALEGLVGLNKARAERPQPCPQGALSPCILPSSWPDTGPLLMAPGDRCHCTKAYWVPHQLHT